MILKIALLAMMVMLVDPSSAHSFSKCGGSVIDVDINSIKLPDPIVLRAGKTERIGVKATLSRQLPDRIKIGLTVEKKILWGYVKVPCVSEIGSCTYDIACNNPLVTKLGIRCPVPAGAVSLDKSIVIPNIPIPSFLASGSYKLRAEVRDYYSNELLGCGAAQVSIST